MCAVPGCCYPVPQKSEAVKVQVVNVPEADKPKTLTEAEKLRQRKDRWVGSQGQLGRADPHMPSSNAVGGPVFPMRC